MDDVPRSKMFRATLGDLAFWAGVKQLRVERDAMLRAAFSKIGTEPDDTPPTVPWSLTAGDKFFLRKHLIAPE